MDAILSSKVIIVFLSHHSIFVWPLYHALVVALLRRRAGDQELHLRPPRICLRLQEGWT
jgi:hypothetical protein